MIWLKEKIEFPSHKTTTREGIIALGGDLSSERLIFAYQNGIFPWYSEGDPIVWYFPKKRMVLFPNELKISKSMRKIIQNNEFQITENQLFEEVIYNCKNIKRKDELGTWITDEMQQAYIALHKKGIAKSIEVWKNDVLVGGLYGIEMNKIFCGESMFSKVSNASKVAFTHLASKKQYNVIDCQVYNKHLASLGAKEIESTVFLDFLNSSNKCNF